MPKTTDHLERASGESYLGPARAFEAIADLRLLPRWFFDNDPHPQIEHPERTVKAVDGGGLRAQPGIQIDVESTDGFGTVRGRRLQLDRASVDRFTCTDVHEGTLIRLSPDSRRSSRGDGHLATTIGVSTNDTGCRITITHETRVTGSGPRAALARAFRRRTNVGQRLMVRRLIATIEDSADTSSTLG